MANLTRAHHELFQRSPDERFSSLREICEHSQQEKQFSNDCWHLPRALQPQPTDGTLNVTLGDDGAFQRRVTREGREQARPSRFTALPGSHIQSPYRCG